MVIYPPSISTIPEHEAIKDYNEDQEFTVPTVDPTSATIFEAVADFIRLFDETNQGLNELKQTHPDLYKEVLEQPYSPNTLPVEVATLRHLAADVIALACEHAGIPGISFRGQFTKYNDPSHALDAAVAQFYLEIPSYFYTLELAVQSAPSQQSITVDQREILNMHNRRCESLTL